MAMSRAEVQSMYQAGARHYDFTTLLFRLIGLRMAMYRSLAVKNLALEPGDLVIELGCGTGLNFPFIMDRIGQEGRLVGIDLTPGMLEIARKRVEQSGWENIELIRKDIVAYDFPERVNAVLATGLFGYIPEYDRVIRTISECLVPGGRISILDGKQPENLSTWLFKIVLTLGKPFGYTPEYFRVKPWEAVERYFVETSFETRYGGMIYFVSGKVS